MKLFIFTFFVILPEILGANLLVVLPHISYSHFKATSKLVSALELKGHNVTVVTPYEIGSRNIKETSIYGIVDPVKRARNDFLESANDPDSYWLKLQYAKKIGSEYARHVLHNENVTKLINSNSTFDLVLVEDVSADALAIFSYIFKCPLVVLLSEPVSVFYDNYFLYNSQRGNDNELRKAHQYAIKEFYREWIILPEQNKIIRDILPEAPDIRDLLYNTSLVFIPSYPNLGNIIPKYPNVKQIGGFQFEYQGPTNTNFKNLSNDFPDHQLVISEDLDETDLKFLFKVLQDKRESTKEENSVYLNFKLFIGSGDSYDTAYAINNGVPVLSIYFNRWFQQFLTDTWTENKTVFKVAMNTFKSNVFDTVLNELLSNNTRFQKEAKLASEVINNAHVYHPIDEVLFWIDYVLKFHGATHLRPFDLRSQLNSHLIEIIIVLVIIDIILFLIFYWIIKHLLLCANLLPKKVSEMVQKIITKNKSGKKNVSYIRLDT